MWYKRVEKLHFLLIRLKFYPDQNRYKIYCKSWKSVKFKIKGVSVQHNRRSLWAEQPCLYVSGCRADYGENGWAVQVDGRAAGEQANRPQGPIL